MSNATPLPPAPTVTHVRIGRGTWTRVVLEDGFRITFVGPLNRREAIHQAELRRERGYRSEAREGRTGGAL